MSLQVRYGVAVLFSTLLWTGCVRAGFGEGVSAISGDATTADTTPGDITPDCGRPETCNGLDDNCNADIDEGACAPGCTGLTYDAHGYMICTTKVTWQDAMADCGLQGMKLVRIDDAQENSWLFTVYSPLSTGYAWMGANDIDAEGMWVWPDGTPVVYENWMAGEPNDSGTSEDCGEVKINLGELVWNDVPCDRVLNYICEEY
jgi:C-type mannose receptor